MHQCPYRPPACLRYRRPTGRPGAGPPCPLPSPRHQAATHHVLSSSVPRPGDREPHACEQTVERLSCTEQRIFRMPAVLRSLRITAIQRTPQRIPPLCNYIPHVLSLSQLLLHSFSIHALSCLLVSATAGLRPPSPRVGCRVQRRKSRRRLMLMQIPAWTAYVPVIGSAPLLQQLSRRPRSLLPPPPPPPPRRRSMSPRLPHSRAICLRLFRPPRRPQSSDLRCGYHRRRARGRRTAL